MSNHTQFPTKIYAEEQFHRELPEGAIAQFGKGFINDIHFSPDGELLAVASSIGIWIYDTATLQEATLLSEHKEHVLCVAFSPNGDTLVSGNTDGIINIWNQLTGTLRREITEYKTGIISIAFSPDGTTFASGSGDGKIRFWDTATGKIRKTVSGLPGRIMSLSYRNDGKMLASGSDNGVNTSMGYQYFY